MLVRPEQVVPCPGDDGPGTVVRHDFHGHDRLTVVRLDDGTELLARSLNTGPPIAAGQPMTIRIEGPVHIWPDGG